MFSLFVFKKKKRAKKQTDPRNRPGYATDRPGTLSPPISTAIPKFIYLPTEPMIVISGVTNGPESDQCPAWIQVGLVGSLHAFGYPVLVRIYLKMYNVLEDLAQNESECGEAKFI